MDNTFEKERNSENISCWTHFYIRSVGDYSSEKGYVSKKEDTFDPEGNLIEIGSWNKPYEEKDLK
jgi:hypothetical protein